MTYTVTWFRFEHGHEWDGMTAKSRDFSSFDKALTFLDNRLQIISGLYWAGGQITDENGVKVYDITAEGDREDCRAAI